MASASIFNDIKRNDFSYNWRRPQMTSEQPPLQINERVVWISDFGPEHGTVRWIGKLAEMGTNWTVGVDLDNPIGTTDGHWGGRQLFITRPKHGLIISILALMKEEEFLGVPTAGITRREDISREKRPGFGLYDNVKYKVDNEISQLAPVPDDDIPFADEVECSQPEVLALQLAADIAAGRTEPVALPNSGANEKPDLQDEQDIYKWYDAMEFGSKKHFRPNKTLQSNASLSSSLGDMEEVSSVVSEDDESPKEKGGFLSSLFRWLWKGKPKKRKTAQETEQNLVRVQSGSIHSVTSTSSSFQYVPMDFTLDKKKMKDNQKSVEKLPNAELAVDLKGNSDDLSETGTFKIITDTISKPEMTKESLNDKIDLEEMPTLKLPVPEGAVGKKSPNRGHPPYKSKNVVRSRSTGTYRRKKRRAPLPPNFELEQRKDSDEIADASNDNKKKRIAYVKGKRRAPSPPAKKNQGTNTGQDVRVGSIENIELKDDESTLSTAEEVSLSSLPSSPSLKVTRNAAVNTTLDKSSGTVSTISGDSTHSQAKPDTVSTATNTTISRTTGNSHSKKPEMVSIATNTTLVKPDFPSEPNHIKSLLEFPPFPHPRLKLIERKKLFSKCASLSSSPKLKKARSEPGLDTKNSFDSDDDMDFPIGHLGYDVTTTTSNDEYRPLSVIKSKQNNIKASINSQAEGNKSYDQSSKITEREQNILLEENQLVKKDKRNKNDNLQLHPVVTEEWKGRGLSTQKLINMFNALSAATLERQEKAHSSSAYIRKLSIDKEFTESDIHSTALQNNKESVQNDKIKTDSAINDCLKQQNTNLLKDDPNQLTVYFNQPKASEELENSVDDEDNEVDTDLYVNVVPLNSDTAVIPRASPRRTVDQGGRTYTNLRDFHLLQESTSLDTEELETDVNMYENLADLALESLDEDDKNKLEVALAESESDSDLSEPIVYENIKQMEEDLHKEAKASQISAKQSMIMDVDSDDSDLNEPVVYENIRQIEEKTAQKPDDLQKKMKIFETSVKEHINISEDDSDINEPVVYENIKQIEEESIQKKTDSQKEIKIPGTSVRAHLNIDEDSDNDIDEPIVYENIRQLEQSVIDKKELNIAESLVNINEDSDDDINEPVLYENIRQIEEIIVQKMDDLQKKVKVSETLAKQPVNINTISNNEIGGHTKENRTADFLKKSSRMEPTLPGIYENIEGIQDQLQSNVITPDSKNKNVNKFPNNSLDSRYKSAENIKELKADQKSDLPSNSNLVKGHSMDLQKDDAFIGNDDWEKRSDCSSAIDRTVRNSECSYNPVQMQSISRPYYRSWSGDLNKGDRVFMDRYHENQANITTSGFIPTNEDEFVYLPNRRVSMETALSCMSLAGPTPPITPRKGGRKYRQRKENEYSKLSQTLPVKKHNYSSSDGGMTQLQDTSNLCKSVNDLKVKEHKDTRENHDGTAILKSEDKKIRNSPEITLVTNSATKQKDNKTETCHKLNSDLHKDLETDFNLYKFSSAQSSYINPGQEEVSPFSFSNPYYMSTSQIKQFTSTDSINSSKPLKIYSSKYKLNTPPFYVCKPNHSATFEQENEIKDVNIQDKASGSSTAFVNASGMNNSNFNGSHSLITVTLSTTQADTNRNNRINSVTTSPPLSSSFDVTGKPLANTLPSVKKDPTYDISRQLVSKSDEKPPRRKDPTYGSSKKLIGKAVELKSLNTEPYFDNSTKLIPNTSEVTAPRRNKIYSASRTLANKTDEKPLPKKDRTYDSIEKLVTTADLVTTPKREKTYDISKKINGKCDQKLLVDEEHSIRNIEEEEAPKTIPRTKNRTSNASHYQDVHQGKLVLERTKGPGQQQFLKIIEGDLPSMATITDAGEKPEKLYDSTDTSKGAIKKSGKTLKSGLSNSKKKSRSKSNLTKITFSEKQSEVPDLSLELSNDSDTVCSKSPQQSPRLTKPPIVNRTVKQEAMKKRSNTVPNSIWPESYEILAPELIKLKAKLQGNPETGDLPGLSQKDVSTLQINKLLRKLEVAIQKGQHEQAALLAKDLAMLKVSCSVVRNKPKNIAVNSESISINLFVEDRSSHIGPINLQVVPSMTVGQLKKKIEQQFEFPVDLQRWILGKKLASNDEATLASYDVITSGCPVFLYLMESDPDIVGRYKERLEMYLRALEEFEDNMGNDYAVIEKGVKPRPSPRSIIGAPIPKPRSNQKIYSQVATKQQHTLEINTAKEEPRSIIGYEVLPDEAERIKREKALEEQLKKAQEEERQANYRRLLELDDVDVVINDEEFECPVCFSEVAKGDGVRLRDCLHMFCRICIENAVQFSEVAEVKCPYMDDHYSCPSVIQDREVRALVSPEIYERYLHKSMIAAESQAANSFHCKTADCRGWCVYEDNVNEFVCPVCNHTNCLTCQAIHEGLNCRQYQDKVEYEAASSEEAKKTKDALDQMLEEGQAMRCPKCQVILMKKWGCDWLKCSMCQTEICWVTKGPRWGPAGQGDTSGGCMCGVNGVRCHPKCNYCH